MNWFFILDFGNCHNFAGKILSFCKILFKKKFAKKKPKRLVKFYHNWLQHEKVFKKNSFIFWILPNLVKYTYGWLPIEQHHKIEKIKIKAIKYEVWHINVGLEPKNCCFSQQIWWGFKGTKSFCTIKCFVVSLGG
jgi:hypothetical protein